MGATIYIHEKEHRGKLRWFLRYRYSDAVDKLIRSLPGRHWSQTNKAWYIPDALNRRYAGQARFILEQSQKKAATENRAAVKEILHSDKKIQLKLNTDESIAPDFADSYSL